VSAGVVIFAGNNVQQLENSLGIEY